MLTIDVITGDGRYFTEQTRVNYYTQGGEPPGHWMGSGAEALGLAGRTVSQTGLKNLLSGFHPDRGDIKLVANAGKERQRGHDLVFSAPKSYSVAWAGAPRWLQKEMEDCFMKAVEKTIQEYVEPNMIYTRRGKGGHQVEHAKPVVAVFPHSTSRENDPQLHAHALFANLCVRNDGSTGTLFSEVSKAEPGKARTGWNPILRHRDAAGSVFQLNLAAEYSQRIGGNIERGRDRFSFRLSDVPLEAEKHFSKRHEQVEEAKAISGFRKGKGSHLAALNSRKEKELVQRKDLFENTQLEIQQFGLSQETLGRMCFEHRTPADREQAVKQAIVKAQEELAQESGHFPLSKVVELAANNLVATGISFEELDRGLQKEITDGCLISLGRDKLERVVSSEAVLQLEQQTIQRIEQAKEFTSHSVADETLRLAIAKTERREGFNYDEQYRTALNYLTQGMNKDGQQVGGVRVLRGGAGSGKTTLLTTVKDAFEQEGYRVVGATLAGKARDRLQEETGTPSSTIEKWNYETSKSKLDRAAETAKAFVGAALGRETWLDPKNYSLDEKTVLIIDEASMTDTTRLNRLLNKAVDAEALVILAGDEKQCQAIGHGGAFQLAQRLTDSVEISKNFRQQYPEDRELVAAAQEGRSLDVLKNLSERGRLYVDETKQEVRQRLVHDWKEEGVRDPRQNKIFVGTHEDRKALNELCQQERISSFKRFLGLSVTNPDGQKLYAGDVIQFRDNLRMEKQRGEGIVGGILHELKKDIPLLAKSTEEIRRGQFGTLVSIDPWKQNYRVQMDDGRLLTVPMYVREIENRSVIGDAARDILFGTFKKRQVNIALGYATTTHSGQGSEFDHVRIMTSDQMQDRELSYTQLSRGKYTTKLFTTSVEAGGELTQRSKLWDSKRESFDERSDLQAAITDAASTKGERLQDSPLAKMMSLERQKEFGLQRSEGLESQLSPELTEDELRKMRGHSHE